MYRFLFAILAAIVVSILIVTGWYVALNFQGVSNLLTNASTMLTSPVYWLGIAIFSFMFFCLFTLPMALMISADQKA